MAKTTRYYDKNHMRTNEDWWGNNIAIPCPCCGRTYITSGQIDRGGRLCPGCHRSHVIIDPKGTMARVEWDTLDVKKDSAA